MSRDSCPEIQEKLVDFADGVLSGEETIQVREHIEQCAHCRATVDALGQSLEAARVIWQDNLRADQAGRGHARRTPIGRYLAAAACVALTIGAAFYWSGHRRSVDSAPTLAAIENEIAASASAARILAAVDKLESQPALREIAKNQYRYIIDKYPDTPAAQPARLKLESLR
jgi:predicted anti-sigma-YlaC factor YlaD